MSKNNGTCPMGESGLSEEDLLDLIDNQQEPKNFSYDFKSTNETCHYEFVKGPKLVSVSDSGDGFINVDTNGQVIVTFPDGTLMKINPNCRMYDAPHLVCWLPDGSEVAFFVHYNKEDCMCIVRRMIDKADMWYIHSVPTAVVIDTSSDGSRRITPIVNGIHAFKAPFYFDDSEMVPNAVIRPQKKSSNVEEKPVSIAEAEKKTVSSAKAKNHTNFLTSLRITLALIFSKSDKKQVFGNDSSSKNNLLIIIAIATLIIAWITASVLFLMHGNTKAGLPVLGIGSLGILYAIIGRIAVRYEPRTSRNSLRWRIVVFFVASFSTLTYQIARGINALIVWINGSQPALSSIFAIEAMVTVVAFVVFAILCRRTKSDKKAVLFAWLRMASLALFIGFFMFWSRMQKTDYETQPYQDNQIELIEPEEDV